MNLLDVQAGLGASVAAAFLGLRSALADVIRALGVDPGEPQELARRLRVSRSLTWRISKAIREDDLAIALQHLPGETATGTLLQAAAGQGVEPGLIERARSAREALDRVVQEHSGDRATLDLILGSMTGQHSAERAHPGRRTAFRGNSVVWGIQARGRSVLSVIAPHAADPTRIDTALVSGFIELRRLRPELRWPLFRPYLYHDDGSPVVEQTAEVAIDPAYDSKPGPKLIGSHCSPGLPTISLVKQRRGSVYELGPGPVGNAGAFDCFYGSILRGAVPRYATPEDRFAETYCQIALPVEALEFDLFVHRDIPVPGGMEVEHRGWGSLGGAPDVGLPMAERAVELMDRHTGIDSTIVPRYNELVNAVFERGGWARKDFRVFRLSMAYPPMHTVVLMRFPLESARL